MAKYIVFPFADTGDKTPIPDLIQGDGSVSWQQGFSVDYELDYPTDPDALPVPRLESNQYIFDVSNGLKQYQELGFNDFITTGDNLGVPFPYDIHAVCRYDSGAGFNLYQSIEAANSTLPTDTTKWKLRTGGIIPISATAIITGEKINQEFEVDVTAGDVVLTLPPSANWIAGDAITFRITAADANEDNMMQIVGDGAELISNYNDHNFFFVGSWVTVRKTTTGLIISDYWDALSLVWSAFFDNGQSQVIAGDSTIIYPTIIEGRGSFYNAANGHATLKIRGQYLINAKGHSSAPLDAFNGLRGFDSGANEYPNSHMRYFAGNTGFAYSAVTFNVNGLLSSEVVRIAAQGYTQISGSFPGFEGFLTKRTI